MFLIKTIKKYLFGTDILLDQNDLEKIIYQAITKLIELQPELLDLYVTERALSHYLAIYISELVPQEFNVDVEYNRHRDMPKRLKLPPRKALDEELSAITVYPDIIIHKRYSDEFNLLVIEMKKPNEDIKYDNLKLHAFRNELRYRHTAHVILGRSYNGELVKEIIWVVD